MYQIVFFIPQSTEAYTKVPLNEWSSEEALRRDINSWSADAIAKRTGYCASLKSEMKLIFTSDFSDVFEKNRPTFSAYLSMASTYEDHVEEMVKQVIEAASPIYPIVLVGSHAASLPEELAIYQGALFSDYMGRQKSRGESASSKNAMKEAVEDVITHALQSFGLTSRRKVFISYSCKEESALACEIYQRLVEHRYAPFLDRYALEPACDFQEGLYQELADCDILLLLDSGANRESKWCQGELEAALATGMGVVVLPLKVGNGDLSYLSQFSLCILHALKDDDIEKKQAASVGDGEIITKISEKAVQNLIHLIDESRSRAYFSKIATMLNAERRNNKDASLILKNDMLLIETSRHGNELLCLPVVGVPSSTDFQRATQIHNDKTILYNKFCISASYGEHLSWLSSATSINIQNSNDDIVLK